jgi:hypothetical protein
MHPNETPDPEVSALEMPEIWSRCIIRGMKNLDFLREIPLEFYSDIIFNADDVTIGCPPLHMKPIMVYHLTQIHAANPKLQISFDK